MEQEKNINIDQDLIQARNLINLNVYHDEELINKAQSM